MTRVEYDTQKVSDLINKFMCDMYFEGYKFDTSFTLRFGRNSYGEVLNQKLPLTVELYLLGDWWFYSRDEWNRRLSLFNSIETLELEEPLQAFELTNLRWCGNSEICSVLLKDEIFKIKFKNERYMEISCAPVEGESWILIGQNNSQDEDKQWSITCEGKEYFVNIP